MKFTGHERDLGSLANPADDLDSMHARHYSPLTGRFLSVDPLISGSPERPQSWDRYSYVGGNPSTYIDPNGEAPTKAIVYLVKGVSGLWRRAGREAAVRAAARRPHSVIVEGRGASKEAARIAEEASPGARIVRHDPHRPGDNPHYQRSTGGGHASYIARDVASMVTVAYWLANQGAFLEFLGYAADFFNPLALGRDVIDLYEIFIVVEQPGGDPLAIMEAGLLVTTPGRDITDVHRFLYLVGAHGYATGQFVSTYELFNSGTVCIEGVCR
jgi:RHS repeat-associated protein